MTKFLWLFVTVLSCAASTVRAQEASFDVFEYRVEGTTLLPTATVEKAVYPHLGEKKTLADVENARESLEKAYADAGYLTVLVNIPQQKVDGGVVRLQVTEAPVDRLRVVESRYFSLGQIKAGVPELAEGNVPNFTQMQSELADLNRNGSRRVTPVLRPGKQPGTIEVDLKVEDQLPLHGYADLNNRYSKDTTPTRLNAGLRWDNLWQAQHSLSFQLQTVPERPSESNLFMVGYAIPLSGDGQLLFYGLKADSSIAAVGTLNVLGKSRIYGVRYVASLPGREGFSHTATLGLDHKDIFQSIAFTDADGIDTPITYMPLTLGWDGTWSRDGRDTKFGIAFNFHVRGMAGSEEEFENKGLKAKPGYSYFRGSFSHDGAMQSEWGLSVRSSWQFTEQPLVPNEQFSIGGSDTVRGYLESAAVGDTGIALTLEASTPNFSKRFSDSIEELRLIAFVDSGTVRVIEPNGATPRFSLTGVGVGLRAKAWHGAIAELDWATAMEEIGATKKGDGRLSFKLRYEW